MPSAKSVHSSDKSLDFSELQFVKPENEGPFPLPRHKHQLEPGMCMFAVMPLFLVSLSWLAESSICDRHAWVCVCFTHTYTHTPLHNTSLSFVSSPPHTNFSSSLVGCDRQKHAGPPLGLCWSSYAGGTPVQHKKLFLRSNIHTENCHPTPQSHFLWHSGPASWEGSQLLRPGLWWASRADRKEAGKRATGLILLIYTSGTKCQCAFSLFRFAS